MISADVLPEPLAYDTQSLPEAWLAAIIHSSDDAIIGKTLQGVITSWNAGAQRIFGYTAEEAVGKSVMMLIPEDRKEEEPLILERLKRGERVDHFQTQRVNRNGELLDISLTISPIRDPLGNIIGVSKIARNITDQLRAERLLLEEREKSRQVLEETVEQRTRELSETNRRLKESNQELEQFAYIASHDLQEPLRKIQVFSELVEMRLQNHADTEVLRYFGKIKDASSRMSRLIRDVLEYSRLSNTGKPFQPVDLGEVLRDVLTEFDLQIVEKRALVIAPEFPVVPGIPAQLYQLFRNLIGNALKFSRQDPVITITAERGADSVKLIFQDNGIGFPQEYASTIFRIFQRLNRQDAYVGSGIGLAMCKKIVENHRGYITARGAPDMGATFTVCLPC